MLADSDWVWGDAVKVRDVAALGTAYAASLLAYAVHGPAHPFSASFAVTNACNIHCSYCSCPSLDKRVLEIPQIGVLFDKLRALGVRRLGLLGGEPLVRKDIHSIIHAAKERGMYVSVNSNLLLHDKLGDRLRGADLIFTSLDGRPDVHRANRGVDSWEGILPAIDELRSRGTPVVAICVLTDRNLMDLDWLLELARAHDFKMHFQPQCSDSEITRGGLAPNLNHDQYRAAWRLLEQRKQSGAPITSSLAYLQFMQTWPDYKVSSVHIPGVRCAAGRGFLFVDPLGNAWPCAYTKGKTTPINLLTQDWAREFRGSTPCNDCSVGPMAEFNLLFRQPLRSAMSAWGSYGAP